MIISEDRPTVLSAPAFVDRERYSDDARSVLEALDARIASVIADVQTLRGWRLIFDANGTNEQVLAFIREVMLTVVQYQSDTTEASMHWLGRLPKTEHRLMRSLVNHKAEEAEHGLWAARDFIALGGAPEALVRPATPSTYAVAAMWWRMAHCEPPLGYLGAEYLFENLTARLCEPLLPTLEARRLPLDRLGFLVEHATEDIKHTNLIAHHVLDVATRYPESGDMMLRCFDLFRHVYPMPIWSEAMDRVLG